MVGVGKDLRVVCGGEDMVGGVWDMVGGVEKIRKCKC